MSHGTSPTNPSGHDSDTIYDSCDSDKAPKTTPRTLGDPIPSTSASDAPVSTPQTEDPLRELRERERDLSKRTAVIESLLWNLTSSLNLRTPPVSTSTPVTQFPNQNPPLSATTSEQTTHRPGLLPSFPSFSNTAFSNSFSDSAIREALELVPKFDGHNMPVLQFVRACKRAKELLPFASEAHLVRLLRNKLAGHAYLAVEDKMYDAIDKLTDCLKRAFGPARSPNYYRGQLSVNFMKEGEHIFDYIGRVKDLRSAIIEADQTLYGRPLRSAELTYIDTFTLDSFYDGLSHDLRNELRNEGYQNLDDAYDKAVSATRRLERDIARRHNARVQAPDSLTPASAQSPNTAARVPPPVTILKRASDPDFPTQSRSPFPTKICGYCKNIGHLISECRKRQYNNNNNFVRQGNLPLASDNVASRGRLNARDVLPLTENPPQSTSSDPQPGTSRQ